MSQQPSPKPRVAVLFGGRSSEHAISCVTAAGVLAALDPQQAVELLLDRLRKTKHNYEFLTQVQQTSSVRLDDED